MRVSVAEHERIQARIADLGRLGRAGPDARRPTAEEVDDWCAEFRRRWVRDHRPAVLSTLTGRPTPPVSDAHYAAGPCRSTPSRPPSRPAAAEA